MSRPDFDDDFDIRETPKTQPPILPDDRTSRRFEAFEDERRRFVVVKIGGSLYDLPDLSERLLQIRVARPANVLIVVPGGGAAADVVRAQQALHSTPDDSAHRAALLAMDLNGELLMSLFRRFLGVELVRPLLSQKLMKLPASGPPLRPPGVYVLMASMFRLSEEQENFEPLPGDWDTTSDSIAARAAELYGAEELILLKSRPAPEPATRAEAVRDGGVDPRFAETADAVPRVTWINLRDEPAGETVLRWRERKT